MNRTTFRDKAAARVQFEETVALAWQGQPHFEATALNLSKGGMFVRSDEVGSDEVGFIPSALRVLFQLPGAGPIDARAAVVRVAGRDATAEPRGVALRFESMSDDCAERLGEFIQGRLEPAAGERLRVEFSDVGSVIGAIAHSCWDDLLSVEAELPFLRVGSTVQVRSTHAARGSGGTVRWVTIHPDPVSGVPRLNIGIEMVRADRPAEDVVHDEQHDPVLTSEFVDHVRLREQALLVPGVAAAAK